MKRFFFLVVLCCLCTDAFAVRISDSGSSDTSGQSSTARSLRAQRDSLQVFNVAASIPVGTIVSFPSTQDLSPLDQRKWIECDGRSFNTTEYPELYTVLGKSTVPNLENMTYLRGSRTADVETVVQDTLRDHSVIMKEHSHDFQGHITSASIPGKGYSQPFSVDFGAFDTHTKKKDETLKNTENMSYTRSWSNGTKSSGEDLSRINGDKKGEYVHGDRNTIKYEQVEELFRDRYERQCITSPLYKERHQGPWNEYTYTNDSGRLGKYCQASCGGAKYWCSESQECSYCWTSRHHQESYEDCRPAPTAANPDREICTTKWEWVGGYKGCYVPYDACYGKWSPWKQKLDSYEQPSKSGQTYITYKDDEQVSGPSTSSIPYADGYLEGTNVTGTVSQKTYSSEAWVNIRGKPVTGNSDPAYGEDGKMYPTDRNGNPISEMTAYYDTQSDSNAADETAPKTIYVRYFIRAEL